MNKDELTLALEDIRRQALHYRQLGAGKPKDHEYNRTFIGLKTVFNVRLPKTRQDRGIPLMREEIIK